MVTVLRCYMGGYENARKVDPELAEMYVPGARSASAG